MDWETPLMKTDAATLFTAQQVPHLLQPQRRENDHKLNETRLSRMHDLSQSYSFSLTKPEHTSAMEFATLKSEDETKLHIAEEANANLLLELQRLAEAKKQLIVASEQQATSYEAQQGKLTQRNDELRAELEALPCSHSDLETQLRLLQTLTISQDRHSHVALMHQALVELAVLGEGDALEDLPPKLTDLVSGLEIEDETESSDDDPELLRVRRRYKLLCHTVRREHFAAQNQIMGMKAEIDQLKRRLARIESDNSISFDRLSQIVTGIGGDPERLKKSSSGFQYRGVSFFVDRKDGTMMAVERDEGVVLESFIRGIDENSFSTSPKSTRTSS
jgi:hypothetical protein